MVIPIVYKVSGIFFLSKEKNQTVQLRRIKTSQLSWHLFANPTNKIKSHTTALLKTLLVKSWGPNLFSGMPNLFSSKEITNIKRNCVPSLKSRNMKANISNVIITLIVFSINVRDNEKHIFSEFNTIQP
jgi:hypothetical protein